MKNRTLALPLIVVAAVVALVLGSFGSATAAGLTSHTVKKIAGKVVDKKASSLSVAHAATANTATTANNATLLNSQPASAYQTTQYQYRLPSLPSATTRTYTFPGLPPGKYSVDYSTFASGSTAAVITICFFRETPSGNLEGLGYGSPAGFGNFITNTGHAFLTASSQLTMSCNGNGGTPGSFQLNTGGAASNVTFTRVDVAVTGTSTGARESDSGGRPASGS
jgi:hypothetical protein